MRAIAICAVLAGCGQPDVSPGARAPGAAPAVRAAEPGADGDADAPSGPRLPDGVAPIAYDLTLELDADRASFTGRVAITIAASGPAITRLWLHAVDLDVTGAHLRGAAADEAVRVLAAGDGPLRGFVLPRPASGRLTLVIEYTGRVQDIDGRGGQEEGLFRERAGGRWYLYSQSESIFARRIVPCFDEPRFKPAWRVTAIVPRDQIALGNAAAAAERALPDGRREVRFAELAALPSYLLAIAVGPFERVDAGRLGRGRVPVQFAVAPQDAGQLAAARRALPGIVDALERYVAAPLPLAKLDFVAVPEFFGAMENPGLVTIRTDILVGQRDFPGIAAHELAHQWFGNTVTPAWWDDLWLSEAFASWLGESVTAVAGGPRPVLAWHRGRRRALDADDSLDARAVIHPIGNPRDIEPAFDAIAYDKGAAVLAMFERFVGPAVFQAAVRGYLAAHAGAAVTSQAFFAALAAAASPEIADALASNLHYAGTPVVELTLRCAADAPAPAVRLVAQARGGVTVPVCVRAPAASGASARTCFLAGAHTEQPLPGAVGCPAWIAGNDGGVGYYRTVWRGAPPSAPPAQLSTEERLVRGDDAAIAVGRGELVVGDALAEITALVRGGDPYGALAALEVARAVDAWVADAERPAWTAWLAARFADRLTRGALVRPRSAIERAVRGEIVALAGRAIAPDVAAAARAELVRAGGLDPALVAIAAVHDPGAVFDALVQGAAAARSDDERDAALEALGQLPAAYAARVVDLLVQARFPGDRVWPAIAAMLARGDARPAVWRAIRDRFARVVTALGPPAARAALAALAVLCDSDARAQLADAAAPHVAAISDGRRTLAHALAGIDRCVARRAPAGDVATALARR